MTVELSCCKFPTASKLQKEWKDQKPALIAYMKQVHKGIKGVVTDRCGSGIAGAEIKVNKREKSIFSGKSFGHTAHSNTTPNLRKYFRDLQTRREYHANAQRSLSVTICNND